MTNREWFSSLNINELAKWLDKNANCTVCVNHVDGEESCLMSDCVGGICKWLSAKHEKPMPDLKVGDIIYSYYPKTDNKVRYIYLGGNVMWCDKDERFICFDDEMKVYVKWIVRKNEDFNHKIIWRADDEEH